MPDVSTTYKSLAAGFAAGVVSTAAAALLAVWPYGVVLWAASLGYIYYKKVS